MEGFLDALMWAAVFMFAMWVSYRIGFRKGVDWWWEEHCCNEPKEEAKNVQG